MKKTKNVDYLTYYQFHSVLGYFAWMKRDIWCQELLINRYQLHLDLDKEIKFIKRAIDDLINQYKPDEFKLNNSKLINDINQTMKQYLKLKDSKPNVWVIVN